MASRNKRGNTGKWAVLAKRHIFVIDRQKKLTESVSGKLYLYSYTNLGGTSTQMAADE